MKILYYNDWNRERILEWLEERESMRQLRSMYSQGYQVDYSDGSRWEVIYGDHIHRRPTEIFINSRLIQQTWD